MNQLRTLLIVDDEEDIRSILKEIAAQENIPCYEASSGNEALEIVKKTPITAIISDINMPDGNGQLFMKNVRMLGLFTPFVFLTAYDSKEHIQEALKMGAFDFLSKPFESKNVIEVMYRALDVGSQIQSVLNVEEGFPDGVNKVEQMEKLLKKLSRYGLMK